MHLNPSTRLSRSTTVAMIGTGVMVLARIISESWAQGYLTLGFRFTILKALSQDLIWSVPAAGLVVGLCELLSWKSRSSLGQRMARFSGLRLVLLLTLFLVSALWLARATFADRLGLLADDTVYLAAVFGLLMFFLHRALASGESNLRLAMTLIALLGTLLLGGVPVYWPHGRISVSDLFPSSLALLFGGVMVSILLLRTSRRERLSKSYRPLYLAAAGLLLSGPSIALLARPSLETEQPHNVVFIAIDTLRLDHTSIYQDLGRRGPTTPHMERLAQQGVSFENAISQAPWTMPAFASTLTGLYPPEHGAILHNGLLRRSELTLAEILREAGYRTGATVSHAYVDADHGFSQGFDEFREDLSGGFDSITSRGITDQAIDFVDRQSSSPFFLFAHYADPHYEYRDHPEFDFADSYNGWIDSRPSIHSIRNNSANLTSDDVEQIRDLYDEELASTDREIGRLLAHLEERGLSETTAVILVADHGEEFLERGWIGHTVTLFDELVRVPLVLSFPAWSSRGEVVQRTVETRAIPATVLDYLGIDWQPPPSRFPAASLQASLGNASVARHGKAITSVWLENSGMQGERNGKLSSLRTDSWKIILDHDHEQWHLYDLRDDAVELVDLADSQAAAMTLAEMKLELQAWLEAMSEAGSSTPQSELSEQELEKLRALGYL